MATDARAIAQALFYTPGGAFAFHPAGGAVVRRTAGDRLRVTGYRGTAAEAR
jgi:hypothetical protein